MGGYRGRLIRPLLAEIARLDTAATAAASGYDPDFRTVKPSHVGSVRTGGRREMAPIQVRCQVEQARGADQRPSPSGTSQDTQISLVFHVLDLERASLLDAERMPTIRVNDRLVALLTTAGALVQRMVPEVYAKEVLPAGFGLGSQRNLFVVRFETRSKAAG